MAKRPARAEDIAQAQSAPGGRQQYEIAMNPYTEHDMEMAGASVQQAQAAVEMAEIALAETQVISPIDGWFRRGSYRLGRWSAAKHR